MSALPRSNEIVGGVISDRHDGEDRIESAVGDMDAAVDDIEVVNVMDATVFVDDGSLRVVAHPARAGLVLAATGAVTRSPVEGDGRGSAGFLQPRHDGEDRIESAVGDMDAAVDDIEVVNVMDATVFVDDGSLRVVAHPARAGLVLAATGAVTRSPVEGDGRGSAGFLQPRFGLRREELGS